MHNCLNKTKALFLDRDGVINIDKGYVYKSQECFFVDGIFNLLSKAKKKKYSILVITNQSGIGRGIFTELEFHNFMKWMNNELNGLIDDYYYCPYHEKFGIGKYKINSNNRKPNPGMINDAIKDHRINPKESIFIGDKISDMEAASKANIGCKLLLGYSQNNSSSINFEIVKTLSEAQKYLL